MNKNLKCFELAVLGMALCLAGAMAHAVTIDARLTSFLSTDANLNGTGPAGGIGTFELLSDVTGTEVDFLGAQFMAQCLEPNEGVSLDTTYTFEIANLAAAPTSIIGGMGALNAGWLEAIMGGLGFSGVEDVASSSSEMQSAIQMATYEAANETSGTLDFSAGSAILTGAGLTFHTDLQIAIGSANPLRGYALLNGGNQDFAVYRNAIPEPAIPALMGLGLLGIARARRG